MTEYKKESLNELSKEELIDLVEKLNDSQFLISETCVEESKSHISSEVAIDKIRNYIHYI